MALEFSPGETIDEVGGKGKDARGEVIRGEKFQRPRKGTLTKGNLFKSKADGLGRCTGTATSLGIADEVDEESRLKMEGVGWVFLDWGGEPVQQRSS